MKKTSTGGCKNKYISRFMTAPCNKTVNMATKQWNYKKSSCYLGHIYMRNSFLRSFPNCIRIGCKKCIEYNYIISDCANPIPSQFSWCCQRLLARQPAGNCRTAKISSFSSYIQYLQISTMYTNIYNIYKYLQYIQISTIYRVSQKKLPFVKIGGGKYYCWQWEIHMKLLQIQVKHQALLWQQVNVWVHVMNLSQIALLFFKLGVVFFCPR